jgi:hypothetical protein
VLESVGGGVNSNHVVRFSAVPAGHRLVITNVSASLVLVPGGTFANIEVGGSNFFGPNLALPATLIGLETPTSPVACYRLC